LGDQVTAYLNIAPIRISAMLPPTVMDSHLLSVRGPAR
jgi:hypothetical protein